MNLEVSQINFNRNPETVCYDCVYRINNIYKQKGAEAALGFLVDLIEMNAFAANVVFRRFARRLNEEQQERFHQATAAYFDGFLSYYKVLPAQSGIATATSLYLKQYELTGKLMEHIRKCIKIQTVRKIYEKWCRRFLASSYLSDENIAAYFYYRYLCFGNIDTENELFYFNRRIRFRQEVPQMLIELMERVVEKGYYRYLCSFLKIFPDVTIDKTGIDLDTLEFHGEGDNSRISYIIFTYKFARNDDDQASIDRWYQKIRSEFEQKGYENALSVIDFYYTCRSITRKNGDPAMAINQYVYSPIPRNNLSSIFLKDAIEDAFEYLLKNRLEYVDRFIEKLGENNLFLFSTTREYKASTPMTFSLSHNIIEKMKEAGYTKEHIISVFMNSRLRSCYPFSLLIRSVYFGDENVRNGQKRKLPQLSEYIFSGRVSYAEEAKRFRLLSYNYRNDMAEVFISNNEISLKELKNLEKNNVTVRFCIDQAEYRKDKPGNIEFMGRILPEKQEEDIIITRQYTSIKSNVVLETELQQQSRSVDKMRYLYREFARQNITFDQLKKHLKKDNSYVYRSFVYQINAQSSVFRSFRKLAASPKRFVQCVNTLRHTSPLFSRENILTEKMWNIIRETEGRSYDKEELIELYKQILGRDLRDVFRSELYSRTILKYLIPYDEACRMMMEEGLEPITNRFRFSGRVISHTDISQGKKMILEVNHTVDQSQLIKVMVYKSVAGVENNPEDGSYYMFSLTAFDPENRIAVSRILQKLIPPVDETEEIE